MGKPSHTPSPSREVASPLPWLVRAMSPSARARRHYVAWTAAALAAAIVLVTVLMLTNHGPDVHGDMTTGPLNDDNGGGGGGGGGGGSTAAPRPEFNVSRCIPEVCYHAATDQAICVVEQEVDCLQRMRTESDCVQGGLPVPLSPVHDAATGTVRYHMYWNGPLTRVALLSLKAFLVTQPAASTRLTLWTSGAPDDLVFSEECRRILDTPRIDVRTFDLEDEWAAIRDDFDGLPTNLTLPTPGGSPVGFSDVVRLILLYRYGGVYVDVDTLLVRDLSPLLHLAPFMYGWGCDDDLLNTAVFALAAGSREAYDLLDEALHRLKLLAPYFEKRSERLELATSYFHPWKLGKYIARRQIPIRILSSYLVDPLWMRVDGQEPHGTALGAPCDAMKSFQDFFSRATTMADWSSPHADAVAALGDPSRPAVLPFCYPAFAYHWHNHWKARLRERGAAYQIERWLHEQLSLTPLPPQPSSRGAWGKIQT